MKLEEKLVQLRKEKRFSQLKVAEELGVSRQAISRWEVGAALPSTENLKRLAELYGVPVDALLKEESELPACEESVPVAPVMEKTDQKYLKIAIAVILALGIFSLGYLVGYVQASREREENKVIPISELDEMAWESYGAEEFVVTWPRE